jgi:acetyl esterase/lipase
MAIDTTDIDGLRMFTISSPDGKPDTCVVHFHGGAYVEPIDPFHWRFGSGLVRDTSVTWWLPDYPLAPDQTAAKTVPQAAALVDHAMRVFGPANVIVLGDSAGGGLALAAAHHLRDAGRQQPRAIVLVAPWGDVTMTDPVQRAMERHDLMLWCDALVEAGRVYAGAQAVTHPLVSPLFGDQTGLAPVTIFIGTKDILLPDARRLAAQLRASGNDVRYHEVPEMQHDFPLFPLVRESRIAREQIAALLR